MYLSYGVEVEMLQLRKLKIDGFKQAMLSQSVALLVLFMVSMNAYSFFPVVDVGSIENLIRNYNQLKSQFTLLQKTYKNAKESLEKATKLVENSQGHYGMGSLYDSDSDFSDREWSPDDWRSALTGSSEGNSAHYNELLTDYKKNHYSLSDSDYEKGASHDKMVSRHDALEVNRASQIHASYGFDDIKRELKIIHDLSLKIDTTENNKSALDLNTRMISELAYIQAEQLKMEVVLNQQFAEARSTSIDADSENSKFNRLPTT